MKRRILFLFPYPSLAGGGAQRVFSTLLEHLDRNDFELHLALLRPRRGPGDEIPPHVTVHDLGARKTRYTIFRIAALARRLQPHAVISTLGHMNVALLLARWMRLLPPGTRVLVRESTTPSIYLRQGTGHPRTWGMLYRRLYPRADSIICLSDAMKKDLAENFKVPPEKVVRIYNPVDVERIRQSARVGGNPYSGAGPHLAAAGRFVREKGFDLLLDALPQVLAAYPDARLALLGDGPGEAALRAQAERLGVAHAVSFPGMQQNPWRYFLHAALVIVPSRYDGLPNVPLEALAVGTQVVAADCPGAIREIKQTEQVMLVAPESSAALAAGMLSALAHRGKSGGEPGKSGGEPLAKFNLKDVVEQYSRILLGE